MQQQGQLVHRAPLARERSLSLAELASAPQATADSPSAAAPSQQHQHGSLAQQQQGQVAATGRSAAVQEPGRGGPPEVASWAASPPTSCAAPPVPTPQSPLSNLHTYDQQGSPSIEDMLAGVLPATKHRPSATCMLVTSRADYLQLGSVSAYIPTSRITGRKTAFDRIAAQSAWHSSRWSCICGLECSPCALAVIDDSCTDVLHA